ncbi:MAG: alpha-E domain-containing protein, partial [Pseudomonadota bacterium]
MLSRTAQGLFWMSRYIERAENVARLLDAGRRIEALPSSPDAKRTEWKSILIASGAKETFPGELDAADQVSVAQHLIFDRSNPSSIRSCLEAARENARAMRTAVTGDVWDTINLTWAEMRMLTPESLRGAGFVSFLEWVKTRAFLFRGAVDATLLRNAGFNFI